MSTLFQPMQLGRHTLKNRIFALPLFTAYATSDNRVSPLECEHFDRLSRSGAAIVTVPNVAVSKAGRTSLNALHLDEDKCVKELAKLSSIIHDNGALACIQLNHGGRYALSDNPMMPSSFSVPEIHHNIKLFIDFIATFPLSKRFGLSAKLTSIFTKWFNEIQENDFTTILGDFTTAAQRAYVAGFDFIELHGATGYLITQFLSSLTNQRKDMWGGSLENRMRFPLQIFESVRNAVPETCGIGFRLLLDEKLFNGIDVIEAISFAKELEKRNVAYLSVTAGTYTSMFNPTIAKELKKPKYLLEQTKMLREATSVPVVISGRIATPKIANALLDDNVTDMIGLGRPLFADPKWVIKAHQGKKVTLCSACGNCFKNLVLGQCVTCQQWSETVQHRVSLDWNFSNRNFYKTLIVVSDIDDFAKHKISAQEFIPLDKNTIDRQIFLNIEGSQEFEEKALEHIQWCKSYFSKNVQRETTEYIYIPQVENPIDTVLEHMQENFGALSINVSPDKKWKRELFTKLPSQCIVFRTYFVEGRHKICIPCDLSIVTLMQIRIALYMLTRPNIEPYFVHVTNSPEKAQERWQTLLKRIDMEGKFPLHILPQGNSIEKILSEHIEQEDYALLILGKKGGFDAVRRYVFGSISNALLDRFTDRSIVLVG